MFKQKFTLSIFLLFVSLSANADDTIWKQSHALEKQGEYERAAAAIEPAVAANDEYALLRYAYLKYKQGEYNDSVEYYEKAMRLNPKSIDAKLGMTLPYAAQGRWRQVALRSSQVLLKADGNFTAHERLMMSEDNEKKWYVLGRHSKEMTTIYPADAGTLVYLARSNARKGNTPVAVSIYKKVLMRDPENTEASEYLENN